MRKPWILAHRGASGYRPEHTLPAYRLAIELGADYLEPDVVATADGHLVARHENEIGGTTDVAERPELADRRTTKVVDGVRRTGWFTEDLTLEELKSLGAVERIPGIRPGNSDFDGRFTVPTLEEILDLLDDANSRSGRRTGVCVEIKHSSYFDAAGLPLEERVLDSLARHRLDRPETIIESMETASLRALAGHTSATLGQLLMADGRPYDFTRAGDPRTYVDLTRPDELSGIAEYAGLVGVEKRLVTPRDEGGRRRPPTGLVADAHRAGLDVLVWTVREENRFLPADLRSGDDPAAPGLACAELVGFFEAGVDGVFTDSVDTAVRAREVWRARTAAGDPGP